MMLKSSVKRAHLGTVPDLRNALSFSTLSMMLVVGFFVPILYLGEEVPLYP